MRLAEAGKCKICGGDVVIEKGEKAFHVHHSLPVCDRYVELLKELDSISVGKQRITVFELRERKPA